MSKIKSRYVCQECGAVYHRPMGKCVHCENWGSIVEEVEETLHQGSTLSVTPGKATPLPEITCQEEERLRCGISEFDRVTGGGLVPGSLVLIGGSPGIGKSTLLLSVADSIARDSSQKVVYVTGEESLEQIKMRASRMKINSENLLVLPEIDLKNVLTQVEELDPGLVIIDSIQTMLDREMESYPGSVSQVRGCTGLLQRYCKTRAVPVVVVGHITRAGSIAGPMVLEHMVDAVLYFEGERVRDFRILRALKNRFGSTREIGVFSMESTGLVAIENPSEFFLSQHLSNIPGSVVVPVLEGSRTLLIEIQALVTQSGFGNPARRAEGLSANRLALMLAVMEKRARMLLGGSDVFINVVGGVVVDEPAGDLGVVMAVASSLRDRPLPEGCAVMGEVGLGGEVRGVSRAPERIAEAARMGFKTIILPKSNVTGQAKSEKIEIVGVNTISEAPGSGITQNHREGHPAQIIIEIPQQPAYLPEKQWSKTAAVARANFPRF